jgi:uncharacterized protein (DUF433 family)
MLNVNINGKQINVKTILLWAAVISGGYTLGANYPDLNPAQLLPICECAE